MPQRPDARSLSTLPARLALASALACSSSAWSQVSVSTGLEYRSGDYGRSSSTEEIRAPLGLRYATGAWVLRAATDFSNVNGVANAVEREARRTEDPQLSPADDDDDDDDGGGGGGGGGGASSGTPVTARSASGLGDGQLSAFYKALDPAASLFGLDAGVRAKVPLSSRDECFITNGEMDYSVEARLYHPVGKLEPSLTLGWTKRGDPVRRDSQCQAVGSQRVDFRDPFYFGVGLGVELARLVTLDLDYLYRERLLPQSQPLSQARATLQFRITDSLRLGAYSAIGFTDATPAWVLGTSLGYRF